MTHVRIRQEMEVRIALTAAQALIAAGYYITIDNGTDDEPVTDSKDLEEIAEHLCLTDEDRLIASKPKEGGKLLHFIYGNNGYDVIHDYGPSVKTIVKPALDLAQWYERGDHEHSGNVAACEAYRRMQCTWHHALTEINAARKMIEQLRLLLPAGVSVDELDNRLIDLETRILNAHGDEPQGV